ncbi:MAG: hypothetical protein FJX71_04715 [Alphaproteobacteria bacterium]|nr:hypothetical protein [Alphaproteobacteria bacterium]
MYISYDPKNDKGYSKEKLLKKFNVIFTDALGGKSVKFKLTDKTVKLIEKVEGKEGEHPHDNIKEVEYPLVEIIE